MDKLDAQIAEHERRCTDLAHQLEVAEVELRALKLAASLRPPAALPPRADGIDGARGDRGKGREITTPWLAVLKKMAAAPRPVGTTEIARMAAQEGLDVVPKRAGDRMRKYRIAGHVERIGDRYRVTEAGKSRLGLLTHEPLG